MGHPINTLLTLTAGTLNGIALTQSLAGAGNLVLNGVAVVAGVAILTPPRRVVVHSVGNDSGITWTVTGTARPEQGGAALVETIPGATAGGDSIGTQDFATVTSIRASGATASTVTAGYSLLASSQWVPWDRQVEKFAVSIQAAIASGAPTYTVEYTLDDVFGLWLPPSIPFPRPIPITTMTALTAGIVGQIVDTPVVATRLTLSAIGGVLLTQLQQGN